MPIKLPADATVAEMADALRDLAVRLREPAYRRAANALQHVPAGRPAIDDRRLIEEVQRLVRTGGCRSLNRALQQVARTVVDEKPRSVVERLRRKILKARQSSDA